MRSRTPPEEVRFARAVIAPQLRKIKADAALLESFMAYAVRQGADQLKFAARLQKLLNGAPPTTYLVALLLSWNRRR